ncbi:RbsD/FucU domain-containing protein [Corynebacterium coyleae]|uniref:RbsD/FucU domain-containing protein n=1 Tax=Corynebacterium coyleae TaxID=53374 RepID=UPI00254C455A|nr:RbsD/FucU domain-containing protein [Corynebacterium coyleae]MDK8662692.1 RbsD/FucU domain-containing protein [Corynebacterium coyleae]MDK8706262.1 RbsD/FucU domain-containing protein [Corynebacterium coyleae]MDK8732651.1 RbsD/FucU domain-containing protein [Corynebacterium coyleae]MDK8892303.1 RbsD/FucU domain-containing protein [Corynebacterium coyleae]
MRKTGILNAQLARAINGLGHTDTFAVADCGLPIPAGVEVVDLALVFGVPRFADVVRAILDEVVVEGAVVATQAPDEVALLCDDPTRVDHEDLKQALADCKFVVRTGETTPYANIIFRSGVPF